MVPNKLYVMQMVELPCILLRTALMRSKFETLSQNHNYQKQTYYLRQNILHLSEYVKIYDTIVPNVECWELYSNMLTKKTCQNVTTK